MDFQNSKINLYSMKVKIVDLTLSQALKSGRDQGILVQYSLGNFGNFEDSGILGTNGFVFGKGKLVTFPFTGQDDVPLKVIILADNIVIGMTVIKLLDLVMPADGEEEISRTYSLFHHQNQDVGTIALTFEVKNAGLHMNQTAPKIEPKEKLKEEIETQPTTLNPERNVIEWRSAGKSAKGEDILIRWAGPKKCVRVLPPYHEDVGVQTEKPTQPKQKKGKKNKKR